MKMTRFVLVTLATILVAIPALAEEKKDIVQTAQVQASSELPSLECDDAPLDLTLPPLKTSRSTLSGIPTLSCSQATCNDYIIPQGGSCSCSRQQLSDGCYRQCDGEKGYIVETTCEVCPGCSGPNCDLIVCNNYVTQSCRSPR